jgi:hypothetical protein
VRVECGERGGTRDGEGGAMEMEEGRRGRRHS